MYKYDVDMWLDFVRIKLKRINKAVDAFNIVSPRRFGPYIMVYGAFMRENEELFWTYIPDKKGHYFQDLNLDSRPPQWGFKGARIISLPSDDTKKD